MNEVIIKKDKTSTILWDDIWLARWNQKIDHSMSMLSFIQSEQGWDKVDQSLLSVNTDNILDCTEAILLKASHLRANNQRQKSSSLIAKVYRFYVKNNISICFRLSFELGIDNYINENYNEALEWYLTAEQKSKTLAEKIFTLSNILWCLEALDLKRERYEDHLSVVLKEINSNDLSFNHVKEQFCAYKQRMSFYLGDYCEQSFTQKTNELSQSVFFNLWVGSLPYISGAVPIGADRLLKLFDRKYMWQGSYRYRTLAGLCIPADSHQARVPDAIDRLYLWVWCLLDQQKCITIEKISLTLNSIFEQLEFHNLAVENKLLLRNSLKWLSLFIPKLTNKYIKLYDFNIEETSFSILEQEYLFICSLEESNLGCHLQSYEFDDVKNSVGLIKKFIEEKESIASGKSSYNFEVDISNNIVTVFKANKKIKSDILSLFFYKLKDSRTVLINSLSNELVFDRRKVYNLVARIKKLLPDHTVEVSGELIRVIGDKSLNINKIGFEAGISEARMTKIFKTELRQSFSIPVEPTKLVFPDGFKRQDIEKSYKVSKSSVTRVINKWVEENIVIKKNKGKATHYLWSDK